MIKILMIMIMNMMMMMTLIYGHGIHCEVIGDCKYFSIIIEIAFVIFW